MMEAKKKQVSDPVENTQVTVTVTNDLVNLEEIFRCDGRIGNAKISEEAKFPALVPKNCVLVEQLVRSSHKRVYHCKMSSTLAELRTRFWIPSGRQVVEKVLSKCCASKRISWTFNVDRAPWWGGGVSPNEKHFEMRS